MNLLTLFFRRFVAVFGFWNRVHSSPCGRGIWPQSRLALPSVRSVPVHDPMRFFLSQCIKMHQDQQESKRGARTRLFFSPKRGTDDFEAVLSDLSARHHAARKLDFQLDSFLFLAALKEHSLVQSLSLLFDCNQHSLAIFLT